MKISKIPKSILSAARQNLGAKDENDTSEDDHIENMSPKEIIGLYTGWYLGDRGWGESIINNYEQLKEKEKEVD